MVRLAVWVSQGTLNNSLSCHNDDISEMTASCEISLFGWCWGLEGEEEEEEDYPNNDVTVVIVI